MQAPRIEAQTLPPPPGIIGSLRTGFDAIAAHVTVILMPLALDILLWLGPRVSMDRIVQPFLKDWSSVLGTGNMKPEDLQMLFQGFNVLGFLRTFPVGVSSLMSGVRPTETPWGAPRILELGSVPQLVALSLLVAFVGWIFGALYFHWVAAVATPNVEPDDRTKVGRAVFQTLLYAGIWYMVVCVVGLPLAMLLTVLSMINAVLAGGVLLLLGFLSMWLVVPVFFSPHGIFLRKENALASIASGFHMTRFTLPTSSLFVLMIFLLGAGLNLVWSQPSNNSWLVLVGILGHAFITTALLASSFVYYHNMSSWLQAALARLRTGLPGQQA